MTVEEYRVLAALIDDYQFDGCSWIIDGVDLTKLRRKIMAKSKKKGNWMKGFKGGSMK